MLKDKLDNEEKNSPA